MKKMLLIIVSAALLASCGGATQEADVEVMSVSLNQTNIEMIIGETSQLQATVKPSSATDKTVNWSSSKQSVATVNNSGLVTAVAEGTASITAVAGGKSASCKVSVSKKVVAVTSISLNKTTLSLKKGESEKLEATVKPDDATDKTVAWSSSNSQIASVDQSGNVSALAGGTAVITAKAGEKTATCEVSITVPVESVSLDITSAEMIVGDELTLTATVNPDDATDKTVTWSTSDASVATVEGGKVTALKEGTATIAAKAGDKSAECKITVVKKVIAVTSVELNKTSIELVEGDSETLTAIVKPDDATDKTVTWSTSDESIASVDAGKVNAIMVGSVTITATAGSRSATCEVVVKEPFSFGPVDLGLSVKWANANLGATAPEGYGDYYAWGETETKENYSWETYKWCNGDYNKLTKYNTSTSYGTVDNKTSLDADDDVAHVKLGGSWRMPTDEEWWELMKKCTWTWTTNYNGTGVKGQIVTATNGNSIFLPAAGYRDDTYLRDAGFNGCYWSSSLRTDNPYLALDSGFNSVQVYRSYFNRIKGLSVRPVSD